MQRFTQLFQEIDATTSTNAKVAALQRYFQVESPENIAWAIYLFLGKTRKRLVTAKTLRGVFMQMVDLPDWLFEECHAQVGDSAETIALLLNSEYGLTVASASIQDNAQLPTLRQWMEEIIPQVKAVESEAALKQLILSWWSMLGEMEVFVLNKVLTGAFRVGVSEKLVVRALAREYTIPESVLAHRLMGDFEPTGGFFQRLISPDSEQGSPSRPYPFFLASPIEEARFQLQAAEDFSRWRAEWKWDGIRAQIIRRAGETFIWSRGEDAIAPQFPELTEFFLTLPDGLVFDGEIICWRDGKPLDFYALQKRLGRKRISKKVMADYPVRFVAYDLLEYQGRDIREQPWGDRRQLLTELIQPLPPEQVGLSASFTFETWDMVENLRNQSRQQGAEGLMIKAVDSPYLVGRKRGYWWKYKVDPMALDAVLLYAQAGTGKRANLFTDYTFALWQGEELVPFAKAYSGLDNQEIEQLDRWIRQHTLERFGPVRSVQPIQVFEIAFEGIARSDRHKSGIAVRFPRILRWRKDKPVQEADTLESALELLALTPNPKNAPIGSSS
ncbi:MAG: ATP-dependent DNA ligase [Oscillatoriales cyanobacterium RM1_1_9]|nr:ATP-dependent DNA ligase [Oscillatoriales cyanobacterium RM1_1_9]